MSCSSPSQNPPISNRIRDPLLITGIEPLSSHMHGNASLINVDLKIMVKRVIWILYNITGELMMIQAR